MVQFNLLPDVKITYLKVRRQKRLIVSIAALASIVCVAAFVFMYVAVQVVQAKHIRDLTADIQTEVGKIRSVEDLEKVLTIQNQLTSLGTLHDEKPIVSRLFTYIAQTTPSNVSINKFEVDTVNTTMEITGFADSATTINTYIDTLKFATYTTESTKDAKPFSAVRSELSRDDKASSFKITMTYDPVIFKSTEKVTLVVPSIITTRSETDKPKTLFEKPVEADGEEQ